MKACYNYVPLITVYIVSSLIGWTGPRQFETMFMYLPIQRYGTCQTISGLVNVQQMSYNMNMPYSMGLRLITCTRVHQQVFYNLNDSSKYDVLV